MSTPSLDLALLDRAPLRRWSAVRAEDVPTAVDAALARARAELAELVAAPERTYANTVQALDDLLERLDSVYDAVRHLVAVATTPALRDAHHRVEAPYQAFRAAIPTNPELWAALRSFAETPEAADLDPLRRRHLDKTLRAARRAGADLATADREAVASLRVELSRLSTTFAEHVLDATNAFERIVTDETELAGLPESAIERAAADAHARGVAGWRFTLQAPSYLPVMMHAQRRTFREAIWRAHHTRATEGDFDNRPVLREIFRKRRQLARRLGYDTYADLVLEERMVGSTERARRFVDDLTARTRPYFEAEMSGLAAFAREHLGLDTLAPWDVRYAFERAREVRFDLDEAALRPYLPFDRVEAGVFELARRSFGLTIRPVAGVDVWHPSVRTYEAIAEDGTPLGTFYTDWFPRESKRGGAWMHGLVNGGPRADGGFDPHVAVVVGNLTPPAGDRPSLLTTDEVRTVFHEYGHLFHALLTRVDVRARGAGAVPWDFIELPSLIMENWTWTSEGLASFAFHHETGASLPPGEVTKLLGARRFGEAWTQMRQLSFAAVDLALHVDHDPDGDDDATAFARDVMAAYEWHPSFAHPGFICGFSHILAGGYAAGYYSYKWSEVLEADAFTRFEAAGVFDAATGRAFVKSVLERGDSVDADTMFHDFMGRAPNPEALVLRNLGPAPAAPADGARSAELGAPRRGGLFAATEE